MIPGLYEFAKKWAITGSVYIISDPHFLDKDCKLIDPAWPEPQEYLTKLKRATKSDTLICLGDCGDLSYFKQLKCYKVLIKGNHDDKVKSLYTEVFDEVYEGPVFISDRILLSHEPVIGLSYCMNIHGHTHDKDRSEWIWDDVFGGHHICLAANVIEYQLFSLGDFIKHGILAKIKNIHRETIDGAMERNLLRRQNDYRKNIL